MEVAEPIKGRVEHAPHRVAIAYIGVEGEYLAAGLFERPDRLDPDARWVTCVVLGQPLVPLAVGRERRAADENETRPVLSGEVLGNHAADLAQAAGDQVDASLPQVGLGRLNGRQTQRNVHLFPPLRSAI